MLDDITMTSLVKTYNWRIKTRGQQTKQLLQKTRMKIVAVIIPFTGIQVS